MSRLNVKRVLPHGCRCQWPSQRRLLGLGDASQFVDSIKHRQVSSLTEFVEKRLSPFCQIGIVEIKRGGEHCRRVLD